MRLADLCNGSTPDSDSVCEGSNPSSAANPVTVQVTGFLLLSYLFIYVKMFK